ncbi:MAG TPA: hypothetical protein VF549_13940 [Solirubrobacteraceae bacterium]|jgi:hypothetical protein
MRAPTCVAIVLSCLACAPPAGAQSGFAAGFGPASFATGPVFADGRLAWVEAGDDLAARLVVGDAGAPPTVIARAAAPPGAQSVSASFGVSRSTALLWVQWDGPAHKGGTDPVGVTALAGPPGALHPIAAGAEFFYSRPELVGDHVVLPVYGTPGTTTTAAIRFLDPATGAHTDVAGRTPWSAAGDLVAHLDGDLRPVVTNWRDGTEVYRPQLPADWPGVDDVELAADGSAVWSATTDRPGHPLLHGVTSPDAPAIRELPLPANAAVLARAGDRLLYRDPGDGGFAVSDFDGRVVARVPVGVGLGVPAIDGHRIALTTLPCAVPVIQVWDYEGPPPPVATPAPCHGARLGGRPEPRGRTLRVPLRCPADASGGCVTDVEAVIRRHRRPAVTLGAQARLAAGERRAAVLEAGTAAARRALRGPMRVTVFATAAKLPGERFVRRFRLRPPPARRDPA